MGTFHFGSTLPLVIAVSVLLCRRSVSRTVPSQMMWSVTRPKKENRSTKHLNCKFPGNAPLVFPDETMPDFGSKLLCYSLFALLKSQYFHQIKE